MWRFAQCLTIDLTIHDRRKPYYKAYHRSGPTLRDIPVWNVLMEIGVTLMRTQADQIVLHVTTATLPLKSKRKPARAR